MAKSELEERYDSPSRKMRCVSRYTRPAASTYPSSSNVIRTRRMAARERPVWREISATDSPSEWPSKDSMMRRPRASDSTKSGLPSKAANSLPQLVWNFARLGVAALFGTVIWLDIEHSTHCARLGQTALLR